MWDPFRKSIEQWAAQCKIVYDKFHVLQHANDAVDEVRKGKRLRITRTVVRSDDQAGS